MRRLCGLLLALLLIVLAAAPASARSEYKDPWRPGFSSPANFYQIQRDWNTPAAGVVGPIYRAQQARYPAASENALNASFAGE